MGEPKAPLVYTSRGRVEGEDWVGVAAVLNARMAERRVGQQELATLSGVSVSTLRQVQHGAGRRVQNKTLAAISRALDWPEGYLTDVLLAGHPGEPTTSTEVRDQGEGQPDRVWEALRRVEDRLQEMSRQLDDLTAAMAQRPGTGRQTRGPADSGR